MCPQTYFPLAGTVFTKLSLFQEMPSTCKCLMMLYGAKSNSQTNDKLFPTTSFEMV